MQFLTHGSHRIGYELDGPNSAPAYVLVNGLTQYSELWTVHRDALTGKGFRVATFDLLGQGASDKPELFISQDDQVEALRLLFGELGDCPVFLCGISFGGLIALRYAIEHGEKLAGLVPMSTFAELAPQLMLLGNALRTGLILGGTSYLQDLADESLGRLAQAAARQPRRGQAAGLACQRCLCAAEPYGVLSRLQAVDAATAVDQNSDHDSQRRVRFPHATLAA